MICVNMFSTVTQILVRICFKNKEVVKIDWFEILITDTKTKLLIITILWQQFTYAYTTEWYKLKYIYTHRVLWFMLFGIEYLILIILSDYSDVMIIMCYMKTSRCIILVRLVIPLFLHNVSNHSS